MKPDRGPVRETRIPATASHRMAVPRGFPRENADRENAGQRREARDFETIEIRPVRISGVARIGAGKRALHNGNSAIDVKLVLMRSRAFGINNRRDLVSGMTIEFQLT